MSFLDTAMRRLRQLVTDELGKREPFRAIVTSVDGTTGMVTIRRPDSTTAEAELRARIGVGVLAVDDEVLCLPVAGKPVVIGKVYRTSPPPTSQIYTVVIQRGDNGVLQGGDYAEFRVPIACQIDRIAMTADVDGGGATTDVFKASYANWPTLSDMSDPGNGPAIVSFPSSAQKIEQTTFTSWTTRALAVNDICRIALNADATSIRRLTVQVTVTPT